MKHAPVLVLDVDKDFEHDAAAQGVLMAQVGTAEAARLGGIPLPGAPAQPSESCQPLSLRLIFIFPWKK